MKDKNLNKLMAELDNWFNLDYDANAYRGGDERGRWRGNHPDNVSTDIPVYTEDDSATDRVIRGLTRAEQTTAAYELSKMATNSGVYVGAFIISAETRDKCIVALLAKGRLFRCKVCKDHLDCLHMSPQHGVCEKCEGKLVHNMDMD